VVIWQGGRVGAREKPLVVYDGGCGFCMRWVERLRRWSAGALDFAPYQEAAAQLPSIPLGEFERSVQLVGTDGRVFSGAEAVFRALAHCPRARARVPLWCYRRVPGFAAASEAGYRFVARHRGWFGKR
jgi:predicted DCC family thiol-disulfide oxidoreductase YuxK